MRRTTPTVISIIMAIAAVITVTYLTPVFNTSDSPELTFTTAYFSWTWSPAAHYWNRYAPINYIGPAFMAMPLAAYDAPTNTLWPVLARNWSTQVLPNGSGILTVYLRRNIYWFNGSATLPFTAWDVYAEFYIGVKAFHWYYPFMNYNYADEDIRVINNYTIQFLFNIWSPTEYFWILTQTIATPWPVWKPIVEALKTMNSSQAYTFGRVNITEFNPPFWSISPYYVTSVGPTYITLKLATLPQIIDEWNKIFPFNSFQYYPTWIDWNNPGASIILATIISGKPVYIQWIAFSLLKDLQIINSTKGFGYYIMPDLSIFGIGIPTYYPFNIPEVRQAFLYIINRTEVAAAWGPPWLTYPVFINVPAPAPNVAPGFWLTFPEDIRSIVVNFTQPNWTKAAELLKSAGLVYKNGQWYLPNGTPLTLTLYVSSHNVNWITQAQVAVNELEKFGIKAQLITLEHGIYSTEVSSCSLPAVVDWFFAGSNKGGYESLWISYDAAFTLTHPALYPSAWCIPGKTTPFAYPIVQNNKITGWYCQPLITNLPIPNNTIITCVNSTFGYINLTNWQTAIRATVPGSSTYEELLKAYFAWFEYWVPGVEISVASITAAYPTSITIPWFIKCMPYTNPKYTAVAYSLGHQWAVAGIPAEFNTVLALGGYAPPGVIPPLAEAIINGSLWVKYPQYAAFIGLPSPDPQLQACVASYFHVPYTPVTTTTTTMTTTTTASTVATTAVSTVTSTVTATMTTTVTTTAVSTVTVTKPVISTALVAGIAVIVVVVAAVAVLIALRRR